MDGTATLDTVSQLADAELLDALRDSEQQRRQAYAHQLRVIAEIDARGLAAQQGRATASLVQDVVTLSPGALRRLVAHARALHPTSTPSGARLDPTLPVTAQALREGRIGPDHVEAVRAALHRLPADATPEDRANAEAILTDAAHSSPPYLLTRLGREIRDRLDPDGDEPRDHDLSHPERWLDLRPRPDGGLRGTLQLDTESGALLTDLLSPLTAPHAHDGQPDPRGRAERCGDALVDILKLAARSPQAPSEAGEPVTLLVTASLHELTQGTGRGLVDGYLNLSIAQIRRLSCDCHAAPMIFGNRGDILDVGRTTRTVPRRIRRALIQRDGGCTFPHCDRNAKWCHAHHVWHWIDGGPTALWNLALLCEHHHRLIHHSEWEITMIDGAPWFRPPSYVDPQRKPRRNTLHAHRRHSPFQARRRNQPRTPPCTNSDNPWEHATPASPP